MSIALIPVSELHSELPACKVKVMIARLWTYYTEQTTRDHRNRPSYCGWQGFASFLYLLQNVFLVILNSFNSSYFIFFFLQGDRIQASINSQLVSKFKDKLLEGECYMIMNFEIFDNVGSYKASSHLYKINFMSTTHIKKCEDGVPIDTEFRFNFVSFSDIQTQTLLLDFGNEITLIFVLNHNIDKLLQCHRDFFNVLSRARHGPPLIKHTLDCSN